LGQRFANVDVRIGAPATRSLREEDFARFELLHFAAHTRADDQHPWRSCIVLHPAPVDAASPDPALDRSAPGGDAFDDDPGVLRASTLAGMRLPARLAVLSGCESGGGLALTGEGVLGLTSSLLTAGIPAVIATLWPVDDQTTASLMEAFYDHLAAGETVAAALRQAQLEVRGRTATAHPFYWAGFVVVGEGDVRVALREHDRRSRVLLAGGIAAALVLTCGALVARRRRAIGPSM
jgi:CHAT domain-containing protein